MRHLQYNPETNILSDDEGTPYVVIDPDEWMSKGDKQDLADEIIGSERLKEQVKLLRSALLEIAGTSANENSEPDRMADALGEIQGIVHRALEATKEI